MLAAISTDGFIAQNPDQVSTAWTSKEDKQFFSQKTKEIGVVIMGSSTFQTIGRPLPDRLNIIYSKTKKKSLDKNLRFTNLEPQQLLTQLEKEGYKQVAICGGTSIYTLFAKANLINEMHLTVEPVIFGQGVKLFKEDLNMKLKLKQIKKLNKNGTLLLKYSIK